MNSFREHFDVLVVILGAAFSFIGILCTLIVTLMNKYVASVLSKVSENQVSLAKILNEKIQAIETRQGKAEDEIAEIKDDVADLKGQHTAYVKMGFHIKPEENNNE